MAQAPFVYANTRETMRGSSKRSHSRFLYLWQTPGIIFQRVLSLLVLYYSYHTSSVQYYYSRQTTLKYAVYQHLNSQMITNVQNNTTIYRSYLTSLVIS